MQFPLLNSTEPVVRKVGTLPKLVGLPAADSSWGFFQPKSVQKIGANICILQNLGPIFLYIQNLGPNFCILQNLGPIFCSSQYSEQYFSKVYFLTDFDAIFFQSYLHSLRKIIIASNLAFDP